MNNYNIFNYKEIFSILTFILVVIMITEKLSPSYAVPINYNQLNGGHLYDNMKRHGDDNAFSDLSRNMTSSNGGGDQVLAGNATSSNGGGDQVLAGNATSSNGGGDQVLAGNATSSNGSGDQVLAGNATSSNGGGDQVLAGNATSSTKLIGPKFSYRSRGIRPGSSKRAQFLRIMDF